LFDPQISDTQIFVKADAVYGPGETAPDAHRYRVSAYVWRTRYLAEDAVYWLEDQYTTARAYKYFPEGEPEILAVEKAEILDRLKRAKVARPLQ
jgi:hypothetical protein